MPRGNYRFHATQDHPMVVIPESIYARIVIAAEEKRVTPGKWVELELRESLKRHGVGMEDEAYAAANRRAEAEMRSTIHRHEFDRTRQRRFTDPQ
jgi:hypothetical protein